VDGHVFEDAGRAEDQAPGERQASARAAGAPSSSGVAHPDRPRPDAEDRRPPFDRRGQLGAGPAPVPALDRADGVRAAHLQPSATIDGDRARRLDVSDRDRRAADPDHARSVQAEAGRGLRGQGPGHAPLEPGPLLAQDPFDVPGPSPSGEDQVDRPSRGDGEPGRSGGSGPADPELDRLPANHDGPTGQLLERLPRDGPAAPHPGTTRGRMTSRRSAASNAASMASSGYRAADTRSQGTASEVSARQRTAWRSASCS
jgi:hypothetical protein